MSIDTSAWGTYRLGDLFDIRKGKRLTAADRTAGDTPFIGATEYGNGVTDMCDVAPNAPAGCITLSYNGSVGEAFYQPVASFVCDDANVLVPKVPLSVEAALFVCTVLRLEKFRYSYGRKWSLDAMRDTTIRLPRREDGTPHWGAMEAAITAQPSYTLMGAAAETPASPEPVTLPPVDAWGTFRLDALFDVKRGGAKGDTDAPLVSASARNNGVTGSGTGTVYPAGMVTVSWNGSIGEAFYQPAPFTASGDVRALEPKTPITPEAALFVCTVIRAERFRYSYGRKWGLEQMKSTELRLPVTPKGTPDWALMAAYVKTLPYSGVLAGAPPAV